MINDPFTTPWFKTSPAPPPPPSPPFHPSPPPPHPHIGQIE